MPRLLLPRMATAAPMGAQRYETEIITRAPSVLGAEWTVEDLPVASLRSSLPARRRMPEGLVTGGNRHVRGLAGRLIYPGHDVGHRLGLALPPSSVCDVVTVHDFVAWRFPDEASPVRAAAEELRRAAAVITVSEFSADEAEAVLGIPRPHVIPNGVDSRYRNATPLTEAELIELGIVRPYVLCAGGATERKNLNSLAEAWSILQRVHPELTLVLTGPPSTGRSRLFSPLQRAVLTGRLPDAVMPGLVAAATCVVVPSTYEGFGLPVLEGMSAGVPVVAALGSALTEVAGNGALLVEPTGVGLMDGITQVLAGGPDVEATVARGKARAAEFTWERSIAAHARVWRAVIPG